MEKLTKIQTKCANIQYPGEPTALIAAGIYFMFITLVFIQTYAYIRLKKHNILQCMLSNNNLCFSLYINWKGSVPLEIFLTVFLLLSYLKSARTSCIVSQNSPDSLVLVSHTASGPFCTASIFQH